MTFFLLASFPTVGIPHLTKDWEISGVLLFPNAYTSKRVIVSMCEQAIGECLKNLSCGLRPLLTSLTAGFHDDNMISLQKRYGLYGLEHHRQMENEKNVTNVGGQTDTHPE